MKQQPYDARSVANLVLDQADKRNMGITNMALNKIVYFAHAWFLVGFGRPLIGQKFEAWQHGPLVQDIYHSFKTFGDKPISSRAKRLDRTTAQYVLCEQFFLQNELALLLPVINHYSPIPASKLRNMAHIAGGPWDRVWNHEGPSNPGMVIPDSDIVDFYADRLPAIGAVNAYSESPQPPSLRPLRE